MDYNEFKEYLKNHIAGVYADVIISEQMNLKGEYDKDVISRIKNAEISIKTITKNNGIELDALTIYEEGISISPNIYVKPFFELYVMGKPLGFIMTEIIFEYRNELEQSKKLNSISLDDYNDIKDKIVVRLVNKKCNEKLLDKCPHIDYLDLAITFRFIVSDDKNGVATIMIGNKEFEKWSITLNELYQDSLANTYKMYPYYVEPISSFVLRDFNANKESLPNEVVDELESIKDIIPKVNMYILTNNSKLFGATTILYDDVIKEFADDHESNVYILPSSVHELMLVPEDDDMSPAFLKELLADVNDSSVGLIDLLGNEVYYYNRDSNTISICDEAA